MEQRVTRIGAAGAKRGNKAIKYEAVGKTRDPAALFTGWCRRAAASVKITREFHCSRLSFFLLSPAPFLLFFSFFFFFFLSPSRALRHRERERLFRCSISANDADEDVPLLFRNARPEGKAIIQFFIALHPLRRGIACSSSLAPTSLEGTVCGKISFPLFSFFLSLSLPLPPETHFSRGNTLLLFLAVELLFLALSPISETYSYGISIRLNIDLT